MLQAIIYKDGKLDVLDQLQLPSKTIYMNVTSVEDGWNVINAMNVRGAPAISIVAALSMAVEIGKKDFETKQELNAYVSQKLLYLKTSRPTAVNLDQIVKLMSNLSEEYLHNDLVSLSDMKTKLMDAAEKLLKSDININRSIGEHGGKHIMQNCRRPVFLSSPISILTHCNTGSLATAGYGTALGVIRWLHENKHLHHVFCTETRPYNQGARLTAYELVHDHIPATLICDSMVASLMRSTRPSAVVVGADRVVKNGDTANKIGTYQIALCAKHHAIPFYVACPRSTFDWSLETGDEIVIEERPPHEMLTIQSMRIAAEGINCWNPAFDVTPADLITGGIITEIGVFAPCQLKNNIEKLAAVQLI